MLSPDRLHGFTIVELLVVITLVGLLLALGVPSMSTYLQNSRVAATAQNFYSDLQLARAEAIRRNLPVEFMLTDTSVAASGVEDSAVAGSAGQNWLVRAPNPDAAASGGYELIDAKAGKEGNGSSGAPSVKVVVTAASGTFDGSIVFNGFGQTVDQSAYLINFTLADPNACASAGGGGGPIRCRRIRISPGGQIMACDPAVAASDASDTRHC